MRNVTVKGKTYRVYSPEEYDSTVHYGDDISIENVCPQCGKKSLLFPRGERTPSPMAAMKRHGACERHNYEEWQGRNAIESRFYGDQKP